MVRVVSWEPELRGWQMPGECRLRHRGRGVWTDERKQRRGQNGADLGRDEQGVEMGGETDPAGRGRLSGVKLRDDMMEENECVS